MEHGRLPVLSETRPAVPRAAACTRPPTPARPPARTAKRDASALSPPRLDRNLQYLLHRYRGPAGGVDNVACHLTLLGAAGVQLF